MNTSLIKTEFLATGQSAPFTGQWVNTALCKNGLVVVYVEQPFPTGFFITGAGQESINGTYVYIGMSTGGILNLTHYCKPGSYNNKPVYSGLSTTNILRYENYAGDLSVQFQNSPCNTVGWYLSDTFTNEFIGFHGDPDNYYYVDGDLSVHELQNATWLSSGPGGIAPPAPSLTALYGSSTVNINLQAKTELNQETMFLAGGSAEAISFYTVTGASTGYQAPIFFDSPISNIRLVATAGTAPIFAYITYQN